MERSFEFTRDDPVQPGSIDQFLRHHGVTRQLEVHALGMERFRIVITAGRGILPDDCDHETAVIHVGHNGDSADWLAKLRADHGDRLRFARTAHCGETSLAVAVMALPKATI